MFYAVLPAAAQSDSNENKSKDEGKREKPRKSRKMTYAKIRRARRLSPED